MGTEQVEKPLRAMCCPCCSTPPTANNLSASLEAGRQMTLTCLGKGCCAWSNARLAWNVISVSSCSAVTLAGSL